jgi:hypothetical protein
MDKIITFSFIDSGRLTYDYWQRLLPRLLLGVLSGLNYEELRGLIPSKPLKDAEEKIRNIYQTTLDPLYEKLKKVR